MPVYISLTSPGPLPFNQIVFGTSQIEGDLNTAIDDVFLKASEIEKRKKRRFVETKIFSEVFTEEVAKTLESIILPSEGGMKKPDSAFGMFIGYSLPAVDDDGLPPEVYQQKVKDQIEADIKAVVPFIDDEAVKYKI